jgi:tetratricopeptide (TPR) repeat protein
MDDALRISLPQGEEPRDRITARLPEELSWVLVRALCFFMMLAVIPLGAAPPEAPAAQAHAAKGRELLAGGDPAAAERELRQAVKLAPDDAEFLALLGVALGMQRKLQDSDVYLEKALRVDPADAVTRRNLAWNQFDLGELGKAKVNLALVLKEKPQDATAILLLGMVDEELHDYASAVKLLASVPEQVRERPESQAALARAYYYSGQSAKSREVLKELQSRAGEPESIFAAAQVAAELQDFDSAEALLRSIATSYPDQERLGYALARVEYRAGKFPESLDTLRHTIAAGHESSEIYNLLGWCLYKKDDAKGAVAALDRAIALDPGEESNYVDVGMMLLENHLFDGAMTAAEKAIEVAPGSSGGRRLKGQIEFKLGHVNDAEALYTRAVELNPSDEGAILGLATARLDVGKSADAEATLKKGIERLPRSGVLYQAYGTMLLWGQGREDGEVEARAVELLRKAEALDPALADAHYQLGKVALREGNVREALRELETACHLDPKTSKNHYALAQVYRKLGRTSDAEHEVQIFQALKEKESAFYPKK